MENDAGNATSIHDDDGLDAVRSANYFMGHIFPPILVAFGLTGNALSFLLLRQPQYKHLLTGFYMRGLTVFDSIVMLCKIEFLVMRAYPAMMETYGTIFCIQYIMVDYTAYSVSAWILAFFSFDRFIAVQWPLKATQICSKRRAKVAIVMVIVVFLAFYVPNVYRVYDSSGSTQVFKCPFGPPLPQWFSKFFSITDTFLTVAIPFFLIVGANAGIAMTLLRGRRNRERLTGSIKTSAAGHVQNGQILMMLALLTLVYVLTNLPWLLYALLIEIEFRNHFPSEVENLILLIVDHAMATNCALNFYSVSLGCRQYRTDLVTMVKQWLGIVEPTKKEKTNNSVTMSTAT